MFASVDCSTEDPDVELPTVDTDEFVQQTQVQLSELQTEIDELTTKI
jgi:hypothetical protein